MINGRLIASPTDIEYGYVEGRLIASPTDD